MNDEPIAILVKLQLPDGTEAAHTAHFSADEWLVLDAFSTYAAELSRTTLVSTDPGGCGSLSARAMPELRLKSRCLIRITFEPSCY
jgi:hypothetical protein